MKDPDENMGRSIWTGFLPAVLALAVLEAAGCLSASGQKEVIDENARSGVYLEHVANRSFHADHPIVLDPRVIAVALRGVRVQDQERLVQTLLGGRPQPVRVFSDQDSEVLADGISVALSKATDKQQVRFRTLRTTSDGTETTEATLYVATPFLQLRLVQYRHNSGRIQTQDRPGRGLPDATGLDNREVVFAVEEPGTKALLSGLAAHPHRTALAINYDLLRSFRIAAPDQGANESPTAERRGASENSALFPKTPVLPDAGHQPNAPPEEAAASLNSGPAASSTESEKEIARTLSSLKELLVKKDLEIEALRKEVESLRSTLAGYKTELNNLKKRKSKKDVPGIPPPGP
jgi:hypothetical protein